MTRVEPQKTEDIRRWDVLALGPFMMWFGWRARGVPDWTRYLMISAGVLTITYNGTNYLAAIRSLQGDAAKIMES